MGNYETILYEKKDHVATVTINRPEMNVITVQLIKELELVFREAEEDRDVGVVVVTGAGKRAFSAGADGRMFEKMLRNPHDMWDFLGQFMRMVYNAKTMGKPLVGKVRGWCVGGGVELLTCCDLIYASEDARFWAGESGIGMVPYVGSTQLLTLSIGDKRTRQLILLDEVIDAKTAYEWGFVNKVVPSDKLDEEVDKICKTLLNKSMWALRYAKTQLNVWWDLVSHSYYQGRDAWTFESLLPDGLRAVQGIIDKTKRMDWVKDRDRITAGEIPEFLWGPYSRTCPSCQTANLPEYHKYCGNCGAELK